MTPFDRSASRFAFQVSLMRKLVLVAASLLVIPGHAQLIKAEKQQWTFPVPPELLTEQELIQQAISMHLAETEDEQASNLVRGMDIVVGDVRRTTNPPKERLRLLQVAAKGTVEQHIDKWRVTQENQVRQQAMGNTAQQVKQRLDGLGNVSFNSGNGREQPEDEPLWRDTVKQILTPEEQQKWSVAANGREAYRQQAIVAMLVAELDRQLDLTLSQCEKIEPVAAKVVKDYLVDMSSFLERGNGIDFRLLLTAFAGVPEPERQTLLNQEQAAKWMQITADYQSWWQNIERTHAQRLQGNNGNQGANPAGAAIRINNGGQFIIRGGGGGIRVLPAPNQGVIIQQK